MTSIPPLMSLQDLHCANMDRRSNPRNRACWPVQFAAAYYGANRPAAVQLQCCEQLHNPVVQGLRDALYSAIMEIHSVKEENQALKEKISLLENRQVEVSQLQEELKQKDNLLQRAIKKRRARTRAHVETLELLGQLEKRLKSSEVEELKSTCDALEKLTVNSKEQEQLQKKSKKEQEEKNMKEEEEENEKKRKEEKDKMEREEREKVKKEGKEKIEKKEKEGKEEVESKENETVEKETQRCEEEEMNEKREKQAKKKRGKKKKNWGAN